MSTHIFHFEITFGLVHVLGHDTAAWLDGVFEDINQECEYSDNYRVVAVGDSEAEYECQRRRGCCAEYEAVVTAPDGRKFRVGCNYDH